MKKLVSLLAVAILMSSCGNRMMLVKRHYTKGYYVQILSHAEKPKTYANLQRTGQTILQPLLVSLSEEPREPLMTASLKHAPWQADKHEAKKHPTAPDGVAGGVSPAAAAAQVQKIASQAVRERGGKGGGDANIILLVILSLFPILALVAMYLHDGNRVTANFWVDLILHLTIVGYAIFALLVVFGIVDLA